MYLLKQSKKNRHFALFLFVLFSLPVIFPLFHQGFFQSDDGEWMIIRFSAFHQALADGQFPARFLGRLNHGYGYPVANFLYPGFMYLAEPIHLLGFGFVDTIKIIFGASMIGSAIFCYLWLSRFFDKLSSFIGALFYLYTPYHLFDLYKRGSVGELLALAIVPFILWQIERKSLFWPSIGIAALILSHNTLAVLFFPILIGYLIVRNVLSIKYQVLTIIFGLGLPAFFWIPATFELQYTVFSQTQISNWQEYFSDIQLIGLSTIVIFVMSFLTFIKNRIFSNTTKYWKNALIFFFLIGLISLFLAIYLSSFVWELLPVAFVQFPFRFLSITILNTAFLSAFVVNQAKNSNKRFLLALILLVILWLSAVPYIKPSVFFDKGDLYYATNEATTTVQGEYMPKWVKQKPVERYVEKVEIVEGVGRIDNISYNSKKITFGVLAKENLKVRVNTIYYPGWRAKINNQNVKINYSNEKGVMELGLPKGENRVELKVSETPLRLFADFLSLLCFIALTFFVIAFSSKRAKIKARNIEVAKLFHL